MTPETLRRIRTDLRLTQPEFGERIGVRAETVCRWEKSKDELGKLETLAILAVAAGLVEHICVANPLKAKDIAA